MRSRRGGAAGGGDGRRRAGADRRQPLARRRPVYNAAFLLAGRRASPAGWPSTSCRTTACSTRSACSPPGPCPARWRCRCAMAGSCASASWSARTCGPRTWPRALAESGAEILLVPNGSPFEEDKQRPPLQLAVARVTETGLPLVYVNQVGGQDELVFDGGSFALDADRRLVGAGAWASRRGPRHQRLGARRRRPLAAAGRAPRWPAAAASSRPIYRAMVLGLRDYVDKNRFPGVVLGLSGGIDSALSAAVAVDALGPERVRARDDAVALHLARQPRRRGRAAPSCSASGSTRCRSSRRSRRSGPCWRPIFGDRPPDITEENIQSRIRGVTPDGDLEQARADGAHHRQQVRDVGRLRHALRRHVRRLLGAEGRLQDRRVRAVAAGATQSCPRDFGARPAR